MNAREFMECRKELSINLHNFFEEIFRIVDDAVDDGYEEVALPSLSKLELTMFEAAFKVAGVDCWSLNEPKIHEGADYTLWLSSTKGVDGSHHITWGLRRDIEAERRRGS